MTVGVVALSVISMLKEAGVENNLPTPVSLTVTVTVDVAVVLKFISVITLLAIVCWITASPSLTIYTGLA